MRQEKQNTVKFRKIDFSNIPDFRFKYNGGNNMFYRLGDRYKVFSVLNQIMLNYNYNLDLFSPSSGMLKQMQKYGKFSYDTYRASLKVLMEMNILKRVGRGEYTFNTFMVEPLEDEK
jgi:hypothetical protein